MTYAVAIELENWFAFKGKHRVDLTPGVYAVTARAEDDPGRSNWIGKSTFLASMPFALTGWHPAALADGWITPGESSGSVAYHLSDGATIRRARGSRRTATQLVYTLAGVTMNGAEAQATIERNYGMNETDLFMAAFFKQKEMNRLLAMDPAERMSLVGGWLELEPLQRAEELSSERAKLEDAEADKLKAELVACEARIALLAPTEAEGVVEAVVVKLSEAKAEVERLQKAIAANAERHALQRDSEEFAKLNARGLELKGQLGLLATPRSEAELKDLARLELERSQEAGAAHSKMAQVRVGAGWDGRCPVAGIDCPSRKQVDESTEQARALKATLQAEFESAQERLGEATDARVMAETTADQHARISRELVQLRPRALALVDAPDKLAALGGAREDRSGEELETAQRNLQQVIGTASTTKNAIAELATLRARQVDIKAQIETHEHATKLARTGVLVYKAAQRVVAETSMQVIETGTNRVLGDSGIGLSVDIAWAREGTTPAKSCDQCGAAYPTSAKVKVCAVCGATRGKHLVEKLMIGTRPNSQGAAEDLAGIAIRLAASAWLRGRRNAGWSMAMIDEPFGALDSTHRRALSTHLISMLTSHRYGFEQAFVVAHDRGIMDALPNHVQLVGGKEGTRFE